jgi:hypothetical protein
MELIVLIVLVIVYYVYKSKKKKARLLEKYNNTNIVNAIMKGEIWQGQTKEMLLDSKGEAEDIDQTVLKNKKKETWKYDKVGSSRYNTKIILENDIVVGWDLK